MADQKISADPNLASPEDGDLLPAIDISEIDSLKNKSLNWSQVKAVRRFTVSDIEPGAPVEGDWWQHDTSGEIRNYVNGTWEAMTFKSDLSDTVGTLTIDGGFF